MDEKLQTTLNKIVLLCSQNPEFDSALRKRLGINTTRMIPIAGNNDKIDQIEKYLGLDYSVDSQNSVIDYSYIKDEKVKNQLISDNREMMRFRYGTRYHEIDFDEFCRFAHLQAEMLLNYYYVTTCNSDLNLIKKRIRENNENPKGLDEANTIFAISFRVKMWSFNNEYKTSQQFRAIFNNLVRVRNEVSHRSTEQEQLFCISDYKKYLINLGFKLKEDGLPQLNWYDKGSDVELKAKYQELKKTPEFKQYAFSVWYNVKPYDQIIEELRTLSAVIADATKGSTL